MIRTVTISGFVTLLGLGFLERFPSPDGLDDVHLAALEDKYQLRETTVEASV